MLTSTLDLSLRLRRSIFRWMETGCFLDSLHSQLVIMCFAQRVHWIVRVFDSAGRRIRDHSTVNRRYLCDYLPNAGMSVICLIIDIGTVLIHNLRVVDNRYSRFTVSKNVWYRRLSC
jgi:hypothetical protein